MGSHAVITVVLWKWGHKYSRAHLYKMRSMLARSLSGPYRIVCLTDTPKDCPPGIRAERMPACVLPWDCKSLRRMWIFSNDAARLGDRLLQLDLDLVLTDSIDPLVTRPEPFVIWKSDSNFRDKWAYNPSLTLLTAGAMSHVFERYMKNPRDAFKQADRDGWAPHVNSDQALVSYLVKDEPPPVWTDADGIFAYRVFAGKHGDRGESLPPGCRVVSFHGPRDPSDAQLQTRSPWIAQYWN
jgi:hypothetical protein